MEDQEKLRTKKQNDALHRALREIAHEMDMAGYDMRWMKVRIEPTADGLKKHAFKKIMTAMYPSVKSTTELSREQFSAVWQKFNDNIQDVFGIYVSLDGKDEHGFWD